MIDIRAISVHHHKRATIKVKAPSAQEDQPQEQRISISSLSPKMMGAYVILFCVQWVAGMAIEIHYQIWQRTDNTLAEAVLEIIKESGAIGTGAAANSIAIALMLEGIMVLAQMLRKQQEEEARRQGREEGITLGRQQRDKEYIAWAKEKGIPLEDLPIKNE